MPSKEEIHKEIIKRLSIAINGKSDLNLPKCFNFVIGENSNLTEALDSDNRLVHIEGHFTFSPDLGLIVMGDGEIDYGGTKEDILGGNRYNFMYYQIVAEIQTNKRDYLRLLEKFEFPLRVRFKNGKSTIDLKCGYSNMFAQIRSLRHVHVVEDFVRLNGVEILKEARKTLKDKLTELGLSGNPIKYETLCCDLSGNRDDTFRYTPVARAKYDDSETRVGFEITFSPVGVYHPNPKVKSNYCWIVTLSKDLFEIIYGSNSTIPVGEKVQNLREKIRRAYTQLQAIYNKRFDTPNIDKWMDEDLVDFEGNNYSTTTAGRINYILGDEEEFLKCFERWQNAIHRLKYGKTKELIEKPKELGPGVFENKFK